MAQYYLQLAIKHHMNEETESSTNYLQLAEYQLRTSHSLLHQQAATPTHPMPRTNSTSAAAPTPNRRVSSNYANFWRRLPIAAVYPVAIARPVATDHDVRPTLVPSFALRPL